jgi:hypothetical protein
MQTPESGDGARKQRNFRLGVAPVAILAIALGAWLALRGGDDSTDSSTPTEAEVVSVDSLREAVGGPGIPIYWAGEQADTELELSEPEEGRTYIRYLTGDAEAGDPRPNFLTVGTYANENPVATLKRQGKESDGVLGKAPGNATVYFDRNDPSSIYLAYPGVEAQIEVFEPDFKRALQLVNSGQIVPAG